MIRKPSITLIANNDKYSINMVVIKDKIKAYTIFLTLPLDVTSKKNIA